MTLTEELRECTHNVYTRPLLLVRAADRIDALEARCERDENLICRLERQLSLEHRLARERRRRGMSP